MPERAEHQSFAPARPLVRLASISVAAALVVALVSSGSPRAAADELSDARARQAALAGRIAAQKRQVENIESLQARLKADIGATTTALESINADLAAVRIRVDAIEADVAAIERAYEGLVTELASLDGELSRLRVEQEEKRKELADALDLLAERIREAYQADQISMLEVLVSAQSFADVMVQISASIDFADQDRKLAERIKLDRETLGALELSVVATRIQTNTLRQATAVQRQELTRRLAELVAAQKTLRAMERQTERELAKQRAAYTKLAQSESTLRTAIAENMASQKALKREVDALVRDELRRGSVPSAYNGTFIWPHAGRITQEFGCTGFPWEPPLGGCANFHRGIDIAAPRWTPVRAAADGVVMFAGPNPYDPEPRAWIVIIAHSSTLQTWYAHVDDERPPTVAVGQSVRQGQVIAYVGSTGRSTGYHTDWRVQVRGEFANPRLFV